MGWLSSKWVELYKWFKEFTGIIFVYFQAAVFYFEEKRKDQIADDKIFFKKKNR